MQALSDCPTVALIYDFDGTLSPRNMQEYDFLRAIGVRDSDKFWEKSAEMVREHDASNILCYMKLMLDRARAENVSVRRESFQDFGRSVELYPGLGPDGWFDYVNRLGSKNQVRIEHYINSSGLKEMIEGTPIAPYFKQIYACSFMYIDGEAQWPAVAVDFTTKTQFLFMINKGIERVSENFRVNEYLAEDARPVPFRHMIYFGDGQTDIPCMRLVKQQGGHSIAVFNPSVPRQRAAAARLVREDRVNFACAADYTPRGELLDIVEAIIRKVRSEHVFRWRELENQSAFRGGAGEGD